MTSLYRSIALASLFLLVSTSSAEHVCRYCQASAAGADGSVRPKYAPDRVVDVEHIKIDVTPDFAGKTVHANTTLRFAPISEPTRLVELNAVKLAVEGVVASVPLAEHSSTDEHLTLLFAEPIPVGESVEVAITYTAEPKKGFYFRTADMGYPEGEDHVWTQGETHEASHWFPCFDYPNERSTTEVVCRVPADMTVLSNGKRIGETVDPGTGLKAVTWRQDKPHVNYLVCLVAGYFHEYRGESNGVPLGFYTQPEFAEEGRNAFQDTAAILAFFEEEIGVPYPWAKYDQVTIRDFNWGGMENTTLTTLTHETVYSDATENLRSSWGLDAHELAHQWFGDYVTCKDWSHLWLNEGFATYYTHLYAEHKLGRDEMLYRLRRDKEERVLPSTEKNGNPIVFREYKQPWDQFDFRAYPKGSWVLHMLRSRLGEDLYRKAVRLYLERHALSSVVTDDLRQAFEEVSGKPLDAFFDQWVYQGGVPKLKVRHKWLADEGLLRVTVGQDEPGKGRQLFTFPVTLRCHVGDALVDRRVEVTEAKHDFYIPLDGKPDVVRFDPEYSLLADVDHNKSVEMLEAQLKLDRDTIGRVLAAEALDDEDSKAAIKALTEALENDAFYGVRIAASKSLGKMSRDGALEALVANLDQSDARVRDRVVKDIGKFYDDRAKAALLRMASNEANPDIRASALGGLVKYPDMEVNRLLSEAVHGKSFQNQLAISAGKAIGRRRDPAVAGALFAALSDRRSELPGRRYGEVLVSLAKAVQDAEKTGTTREFLASCLDDPAIGVRLGAIEALGELGDRQATALLEDLAAKTGKEGSAAKKALKRLEGKREPAAKTIKELREQLRELRESHNELRESVREIEAKGEAQEAVQ